LLEVVQLEMAIISIGTTFPLRNKKINCVLLITEAVTKIGREWSTNEEALARQFGTKVGNSNST